jgi:hypothetical protein
VFNSFRSQVRLRQALLLVLVVVLGWMLVSDFVYQRWSAAVTGSAVLATVAFACGVFSRLLGFQLAYSDVAQSLRQIARDLPPGVFRVYERKDLDMALVCSPAHGASNFDLFLTSSLREVDEAFDPHAEGRQFVASMEYKVMCNAPIVWVFPAVDEVTGSAVEPPAPRAKWRLYLMAWKILALNARTGVLNPNRAELEQLLLIARTADHVRDMPFPSLAAAANWQ